MKQFLQKTVILMIVARLMSCSATTTALQHKDLDVQTKMSDTIFLDPVSEAEKTVYLQIKNSSYKSDFTITDQVKQNLIRQGYSVVTDASTAHFLLQVNILSVEKMTQKQTDEALSAGYGAALGAGIAALTSSEVSPKRTLAAGMAGAVVSTVADSLVKDVNYTM